MDFARKQLEKYGWSDGKGLGKHEDGISEALKPKLKRSVTGIGHDPASEFNEHWWSALYDKAASNVEVEYKNGKTKKIKTKDSNEFEITNSTWKINRKQKDGKMGQYANHFVRKSILTNDGNKMVKVGDSDSGSEQETEVKDTVKMTDEELFAACGGRTAHKGARHGLKATGKLARIAQQEEMLLSQPQYEGYSHAKKKKQQIEPTIDEINNYREDSTEIKKKKKKRIRCNENKNLTQLVEPIMDPLPEHDKNITVCNGDPSEINVNNHSKKSKRKNMNASEILDDDAENTCDIVNKSKNKKKQKLDEEEPMEIVTVPVADKSTKKSKKKKHKDVD